MMALDPDPPLRLCVVQLDGIPRACGGPDGSWVPSEPLVDPATPAKRDGRLPGLSVGRILGDETGWEAARALDDMAVDAAASRVDEVLAFLTQHDVDVAVFPEYLVPARCLPLLLDFSVGRAVVAGLEYVRNRDRAGELAELVDTDAGDLVGRNVSVLVADRQVHLVTKKNPASGERLVSGAGPIVKRVSLRGRPVRIAVAVCLDYLLTQTYDADLLCVPAFTANLAAFRPDAPRDHPRLLANCAAHGGSQIMLAPLDGPLTEGLGVRPVRAGHEAIVIVDYHGSLQQPRALLGSRNELRLRAEMIEEHSPGQAALDLIEEFASGEGVRRWTPAELTGRLRRLDRAGPLAEAVAAYRDQLGQGIEDKRVLALAGEHLVVRAGCRSPAVRYRQAQFVLDRIGELARSQDVRLGAAADAYAKACDRYAGGAAASSSGGKPSSVPVPAEPVPPEAGNVIPIHRGERRRRDPAPTPADRLCRALVTETQDLSDAVRALTEAVSAADLVALSIAPRHRVARAADLVAEVARLLGPAPGFDQVNTLGAVRRHLDWLRDRLSVHQRTNPGNALLEHAEQAHYAAGRLSELIR
ncbi:hypothetical protein [Amycolatopsis sp. lyj-23]|uniref:hypothetical protein n=1 Tax=Amycolatopsis sp. lyj-23 TaxID=2789283 RepID=UPI00397DE713